ncbi:MAG: hypothetical protein V3U09_04645 [Thermoplasmata archaeon]
MQQKAKGEVGIEGLDMEEEVRLLLEFTKDWEWVLSHEESLRKRYSKKVIAVRRRKVISSSRERSGLHAKLNEMGVDPKSVLITYITEKPVKYLLPNQ